MRKAKKSAKHRATKLKAAPVNRVTKLEKAFADLDERVAKIEDRWRVPAQETTQEATNGEQPSTPA